MEGARPHSLSLTPEQEEAWAVELNEKRKRFVARIKQATALTSPTRRYALYQEWRKEIGDDAARESAKFAEACLNGTVSIAKLEKMVR